MPTDYQRESRISGVVKIKIEPHSSPDVGYSARPDMPAGEFCPSLQGLPYGKWFWSECGHGHTREEALQDFLRLWTEPGAKERRVYDFIKLPDNFPDEINLYLPKG